ncbi:uncharacterized protein LOC106645957 [Copidosoma floridanum]|uniref:uncharacterized protein LOC106645957 n=1 Tax=Copidosoma floridanum TaxID=29053 RepID=UPI0006C965D5|nr:uncharacterized protein LOC106645957 [Copidosoma floridanum]
MHLINGACTDNSYPPINNRSVSTSQFSVGCNALKSAERQTVTMQSTEGAKKTKGPKKTARMKLTFTSPAADEADKTFVPGGSGSLEERKAAFMRDEELMREANKFVAEIVEKAKIEAAKRAEQNAKTNGETNGTGNDKIKNDNTIADWNNRARGFCNRVWNAVFPCFNNNELLVWTQPFRYRFSKP